MKPTLRFVTLLLLSTSFIYSCKKEEKPIVDNTTTAEIKPDPALYTKLLGMGFKKENIKETKGYYQVEGDLLFEKFTTDTTYLDTFFHLIPTPTSAGGRQIAGTPNDGAHYQWPSIVSTSNVENIRVFVDPSLWPLFWTDKLHAAIGKWAAVQNCKINFTHVPNSMKVATGNDVVVMPDGGELDNYTLAVSQVPGNGKTGSYIKINTDFYNNYVLSESQMINTMVHELGHSVGLMHTNMTAQEHAESPQAVLIPGTPLTDPGSVMNGGTALNSFNGLSTYDQVAIRYLYPYQPYDKWITFPEGKYGSDPMYPLSGYSLNYSSINIQWNKNLVAASSVKLELYQNGILKRTIATAAPNTGSFPTDIGPYVEYLDIEYAFFIQIKITSNDNPAISDMTSMFYIYIP